MTLEEYKAHIKTKGYGVRVTRHSDFISLTYTKNGKSLNVGKGLTTAEDMAEHRELYNSRMQHKGTVFDGMMRVIV